MKGFSASSGDGDGTAKMASHNVHSQFAAVECGDLQEHLGHLTPMHSSSLCVMDGVETYIFKSLDDTIDRTR